MVRSQLKSGAHEPIPVLTGLGVEQRTRYHRSR